MDIKTVLVSVAAATAASAVVAPMAATFVTLQASTPGTSETGHTNISGYSLAGRFGAGTSPTLARVQVNETGVLQGVRSNTSSGVSIYGANSAASGLGAGGYFTSASIGGRAMVAEQLSTTGNTVGGLFYNRSTTGGVALWGKHIGVSGTTTGVYGEVGSSSGRAGGFFNGASNTSANLATGAAAIEAKGDIRRDIDGSMESMVPIGYGWVQSNGAKVAGTAGWTSTWNAGNKWYEIVFTGKNFDILAGDVVVAVPAGSTNLKCGGDSVSTKCLVRVTDNAGVASQAQFLFIAYCRDGGLMPPFGAPSHPGMTDAEWIEKYPREAKKYMERVQAWHQSQLAAKFDVPTDATVRP